MLVVHFPSKSIIPYSRGELTVTPTMRKSNSRLKKLLSVPLWISSKKCWKVTPPVQILWVNISQLQWHRIQWWFNSWNHVIMGHRSTSLGSVWSTRRSFWLPKRTNPCKRLVSLTKPRSCTGSSSIFVQQGMSISEIQHSPSISW